MNYIPVSIHIGSMNNDVHCKICTLFSDDIDFSRLY